MTQDRPSTRTLTYHDPSRCFDGTPYEAAGAAAEQASNVIKLAQLAVADTNIQARNAWMQRNLDSGKDADGASWDDDPQAKAIRAALESLTEAARKLVVIRAAASYDPKAPLPR
jgi:hypothetical protein